MVLFSQSGSVVEILSITEFTCRKYKMSSKITCIQQEHLEAERLDLLVPVVQDLPALKVHHRVNLVFKIIGKESRIV